MRSNNCAGFSAAPSSIGPVGTIGTIGAIRKIGTIGAAWPFDAGCLISDNTRFGQGAKVVSGW